MSQILHIFRKDARRHWLEILASLLLLAIHTWRVPHEWSANPYAFDPMRFLDGLTDVLVPVVWCFLIVRVVHGESLVGDRQFWVTRPYEWEKLLAAKVLFVAVFVNLPLFVAQVVLLWEAGFRVAPHLSGVLQMQIGIAGALLMPAVLAAVTKGLGQVVVVAIGAILAMIGIAALSSVIPSSQMSSANPVGEALKGAVLLAALLGAILWQYARRKTWPSRWLLLGAGSAMVVMQVATPYETLVARKYPLLKAGQQVPVQLAFAPVEPPVKKKEPSKGWLGEISVSIPLRVSGVAKGEAVTVDGVRVVLDGPGGILWNPGWKGEGYRLWPNEESTEVTFQLKKDFYEKVKATPLTAHISLALTQFKEKDLREAVVGDGQFAIPGVGLCRSELEWIMCRAPLREPNLMASIESSKTTCAAEETDKPLRPPRTVYALQWRGKSDFADPGISPIEVFSLYFEDFSVRQSQERTERLRFCPGTPMELGTPEEAGHSQVQLEAVGIKLEDYEQSRFTLR
jgi:hypothetical protein